jgi:hypothetical protein
MLKENNDHQIDHLLFLSHMMYLTNTSGNLKYIRHEATMDDSIYIFKHSNKSSGEQ